MSPRARRWGGGVADGALVEELEDDGRLGGARHGEDETGVDDARPQGAVGVGAVGRAAVVVQVDVPEAGPRRKEELVEHAGDRRVPRVEREAERSEVEVAGGVGVRGAAAGQVLDDHEDPQLGLQPGEVLERALEGGEAAGVALGTSFVEVGVDDVADGSDLGRRLEGGGGARRRTAAAAARWSRRAPGPPTGRGR